ncbi:MAG TPA: quercetin 2,3-dioxygenase [Solirubrobacterales bacterium]|nr:quercetin 2,3-dioxygenase [Solirubrobacterales bacterium]
MAVDSGVRVVSGELPGEAVPYVVPSGSGRAHLLLGQVGRVLIGSEETGGVMSATTLSGPAGQPIPLHFHELEDEYFFCVRGKVQVWADDESRVLTPGDVAIVPAGTVHAYATLQHNSMFMGPITPGGWDRFFDFCGTPYSQPLYPPVDAGPPPFEKFGAAQEKFKMTFVRDRPYAEARSDAPDDSLPGKAAPYFLRAGDGPRHLLFGQVTFQLATGAETDGKVAMTVVEGPGGAETPDHRHAASTEGIYCLDGRLRLRVDGSERELIGGDFAAIPPGVVHGHTIASDFARIAVMHGPAGPERLAELGGEVAEQQVFPPLGEAPATDADKLRAAAAETGTEFVS